MSKSKAVALKQPRSKGGWRLKRSSLWVYMLVGGLALATAAGLSVFFSRSGESSPASSPPSSLISQSRGPSPAAGPPSSSTLLNAAAIGQPAPGFSLRNQYAQTYTLTPGDGKNHLLVFFMGNF